MGRWIVWWRKTPNSPVEKVVVEGNHSELMRVRGEKAAEGCYEVGNYTQTEGVEDASTG